MHPLITLTDLGLYCAAGNFYIDPRRGVEHAVITHAHSDHARRGSRHYYCASSGVGLLKARLGGRIQVTGLPYRQPFQLGEVQVSFHSAGHVLGSAQVRVQLGSEVWVASGDYKRDSDPSCEPFDVVKCDTFITEATFGTPKYRWEKNRDHGRAIYQWWLENSKQGKNSLLFGYSLGKAQRILAELVPYFQHPVVIHDSIAELTQCYRAEGRVLAPTIQMSAWPSGRSLRGELILAPPSILKTTCLAWLGEYESAFASGWMKGEGQGFVLSDHADWDDLNRTIDESGARRVFVQHRNGAFIRHLRQRGLEAYPESDLILENYQRIAPVNLSLFSQGTGMV